MIRFLQTKGRLQQILLVGFLSIICIMMVVTLIPGGSTLTDFLGLGLSQNVVAKVGGHEISSQELVTQTRNIAKQQYGPRAEMAVPFMMPQVANMLISRRILLNEADRLGLAATDTDLRYLLQHGQFSQLFFPDGNFVGQTQYQNIVSSQFTMTVPQFEDEIRSQITIDKLRQAIEGGVVVSQSELQQQFKTENTRVKFDYAVLSMDDVEKQVNISDSELRAYYEKQKPQLTNSIPEERKIKYILVDYAKAGSGVSQDELESYYKQHLSEYRVPESVTVRHILISTPAPGPDGKVDQKTVDAAKAKADDVLKQLKAGAKFDDLAKKYSEDPGSKDKGGLIGPIQKGQTVAEFEQAAFGAQKGQTVGPIKSSFGFHIIHVDDKTEAHAKSLDEVKTQIEAVLGKQKGQAAAESMAKSLQSSAAAMGMDKAAASKGLQVIESAYFARNANLPGIGASPALMDAVFGAAQKTPSAPQAVPVQNGWAVIQVTDVKSASTPTFEAAKAQLSEQLKREKAASTLEAKVKELADRARSEHNLRAAAKAVGATVKTSELVKPGDQIPIVGQLTGPAEIVFSMKPGEISNPVPAGSNGVVFSLLEKQEPPASEFDQAKDQIRQTILQRKRGEAIQLYVSALKDKMQKAGKIRINDKEIQRLSTANSNAGS
jgi:peptidyl-prolyl cis-trans isomerase D